MIALLVALGCTNKDSIATDSGNAGDSSGTVDDGVSPVVTDAVAECSEHTTGDTFYGWNFSATYSDPQGLGNVPRTFHLVTVERDGNVVKESELLVCDDGSGGCVGTATDDQLGTSCPSADEYTFTFTITDYDGNSGSASVAGEGP